MQWPKLVPKEICTTPIEIHFEGPPDESGGPTQLGVFIGMCNYSEKSKWVMDAERGWIQLQAAALLNGDILPGADIAGEVVINKGIRRRIQGSSRGRNPDGTVNFTKLDLM